MIGLGLAGGCAALVAGAVVLQSSHPTLNTGGHHGGGGTLLQSSHPTLNTGGHHGSSYSQATKQRLRPLLEQMAGTGSATVHLSAHGDDDHGTGDVELPLKTPHGAQQFIRAARAASADEDDGVASTALVTVLFANGTYYLPAGTPLEITPVDSYTVWRGGDVGETVLSGGRLLEPSCWSKIANSSVYACAVDDETAATLNPKVVRIGQHTALPARAPDAVIERPYTGGWISILDVISITTTNTIFTVNMSATEEEARGVGRPASQGVPSFVADPAWEGGKMNVYPKDAWFSYQASVAPADARYVEQYGLADGGTTIYLNMTCPLPEFEACSAKADEELTSGSRFFLYDTLEALSEGEWWWDAEAQTMLVWPASDTFPDGADDAVVVPTVEQVVWIKADNLHHGAPSTDADYVVNVTLENLRFADSSYRRYGFQEGYNQWPEYPGFPDDGVLRISGAINTVVRGCTFRDLGGAGLVAGNATMNLTVESNTFLRLGQSAVMLIGNATSEVMGAEVAHNDIRHIGLIHGSAGGVVLSSASYVGVRHNFISNIARWGIHVRHFENEGKGKSYQNVIEFNQVHNTGEMTNALGGISVIATYGTTEVVDSVIRYNCIKNVVGYGKLDERPYYSYGIFLDNEASGYTIHHNVIRDASYAAIKVHYGHDNIIYNNIMLDSSYGPDETSIGQFDTVGNSWHNTSGNSFYLNVLAWTDPVAYKMLQGETEKPYYDLIDSNLYFNSYVDIATWNNSHLTPKGTWANWTASGYDSSSIVGDPLFENVTGGSACLASSSPAYQLEGFTEIPAEICACADPRGSYQLTNADDE